jgi:hypothetical protein
MKQWIHERINDTTIIAFVIGIVGFLFQISLIWIFRPYTPDGIHFQAWSSETMMQTVALEDLQTAPLETLWNIHIQPPALDAIRAVLVHIWPSTNPLVSIAHVDILLYGIWSLLSGVMAALIYLWMRTLTEVRVAIVASFAFVMHPASIYYATYLDTSFLSALLITMMYYSLWRVIRNPNESFGISTLVILLLLFTRSLFQWPFIFLFAFSLTLVGMKRRNVAAFLMITLAFLGLYIVKQHKQFGLFSTSSFTGLNLSRAAGVSEALPNYWVYLEGKSDVRTDKELPRVLTRMKKASGTPNFNHIDYLALNQQFIDLFIEYIQVTPVNQLATNYLENLKLYLLPSSKHSPHVIVDRLPWRSAYDTVFSWPILVILFVFSGLYALKDAVETRQLNRYIGLAIPGLYIFAMSIFAEKGENERIKYFMEPVIFLFIIYQFYRLWQALSKGVYNRIKLI